MDVEELKRMEKKELVFFFKSGVIGNLILLLISLFIQNARIGSIMFATNLMFIMGSLIPLVYKSNDFNIMLKYIKMKDNGN